MNNRTVWYEVTLIDQYLNRSKVKTLSTLKIEHDGSMDKSVWTISTEGLTPEDSLPGTSEGKQDSLYQRGRKLHEHLCGHCGETAL